ncbi:ubiquitin carboxyl-terminal hydrolase puf isoform X2 [Anopheles stephensi]|uniref:ubiquitin carboxyl-terminal hydrolase puf isoform X2 n=1 Tax=Anopheles stephensi TaxID=30069 RepID=UPI001658832B|nr:ubiquitin carboxyl-terminal hydrolase puf isoform X2 [Anopheles stephensi]
MCDVCSGFLNLLVSYESRLNGSNDTDQPVFLQKREVEVVLNYIQTWPNRQCMCCYRDVKNFERFNLVVQGIICFTVYQLKNIRKLLAQNLLQASTSAAGAGGQAGPNAPETTASVKDATPAADRADHTKDANDKTVVDEQQEHTNRPPTVVTPDGGKTELASKEAECELGMAAKLAEAEDAKHADKQQLTVPAASNQPAMDEAWTLLDVEKLLILVSKVFLLNFPLYVAYKHSVHTRLEDVSPQEVQSLSLFCDLHESEISAFLLRNVSLFCNYAGFEAMMHCFDQPGLPVSTAHAITATSSNIKLWINYRSTVQLFIPLRVKVLQYMCRLSDQDLRSPATKSMADFMWTAIKDPFDTQITFDTEGLALAFKYFTSSTLTMRLAGMAQINAHINMFNDICTSETVSEVEAVGLKLANWLSENQIISHLFGPNLHVEVIKQSHIVLNFLAVENQITEEHITLMWQAAQLKHCSKTIYDILPSLVKNLAPKPATHLYSLLCRLDPKEHTEQSIYIASALTKLIWMRDCSRQTLIDMSKSTGATVNDMATGRADYNELPSSSENSVSVDGTNSEDEHPEDDSSDPDVPSVPPVVVAGVHKPSGPILRMGPDREGESDNGAPPCKQARHKICCDETTDDSIKVEPDIYDVHQRIKEKIRIPLMTRSITAFNEDATSSDECIDVGEAFLLRKKLRKKRRKVSGLTRKELQELQESVSDVEDSDLLAAMLPDSDCSDNNLQTSVLRHIQQQQQQQHQQQQHHHHHHHQHHHHGSPLGPGIVGMSDREQQLVVGQANNNSLMSAASLNDDVSSFMGAMGEGRLINFLNAADAADHDGSCSSPMSNKSEKNMADFDDEDSPCEEELAQLAARAESLHQGYPIQRPRSIGTVAGPSALRAGGAGAGGMGLMKQPQQQHSPHQQLSPGMHRMGGATNNGAIKMAKGGGSTKTKDILAATAAAAVTAGPVGTMMIGNPYRFPDVCQPGNTLLWDLLQDDKIGQLGESIALEAEKVLGTLLCFHTDKHIRTRFIEGCLQNLAENRSVVTSLKLLPKLFASFQQFRDVTTHQVVLWSERQHRMMFHFFNNLKHYSSSVRNNGPATTGSVQTTDSTNLGGPLYSHVTQIQVRLQFLTSVFSDVGSPRSFRLTLNQVDSLWACLANDAECSDCLFSWLQGQVKGGDTHALGLNAIQHLYMKRLSELKPEGISMVALGLFQQLFTLGREELFGQPNDGAERDREMDNVGMEHLWKIALRATNTDVSLSAIQYINTYYMEKQLKYEHQFVAQCMNHLSQAVEELNQHSDNNGPATEYALMCVQRALMLLNTHLDTFRRRYAYHLRRWALEGKDIGAYSALRTEGPGPPIRIVLQPAGVPDKSFLNMHASDLVADLKAEIAKWWEKYQGGVPPTSAPQSKKAQTATTNVVVGSGGSGEHSASAGSPAVVPALGILLNDGPLRIITQGQEITAEYDERSLADVGFKDNQMVYVSLGGRSSGRRREQNENPSMQPPPSKDCLPTLLLLKPPYFEQLFRLMQTLGDMKISITGERCQPNTKAQLLSRRVWDILAMLPTCPSFYSTLKNLSFKSLPSTASGQKATEKQEGNGSNKNQASGEDITECLAKEGDPLLSGGGCYTLEEILDPYNLQKFMYALHIVESLCKSKFVGNCCGGSSVPGATMHQQMKPFVDGGNSNHRSAPGVSGTSSKSLSVKNQLKLKISSSKSLKMQQQSSPRQQESAVGVSNNRSPPKGKRLDFAPTSPGPGVVKPTPLCSEDDRTVIMPRVDGSLENKENKPHLDGASCSSKPDEQLTVTTVPPQAVECSQEGTSNTQQESSEGSEEVKKQENINLEPTSANDPNELSGATTSSTTRVVEWSDEFMRCGGLAHLYRIFLSGVLQKSTDGSDESELNEWRHDCLASLLRIMCLLGMDELKTNEAEGNAILIPPLNRETMALFEPRPTLERIASILNEESLPVNPNLFKTGMFGRPQVIHYAMNLLVCYAHSCKEVRRLLWTIEANSLWLQRLILDDPEPAVRREACAALYRLCLGNAQTYYELMAPLLSKLVALLPLAENMKPQSLNGATSCGIYGALLAAAGDEGKEPYGPACRDYFWLLCRLVDALSPELLRGSNGGNSASEELQPRDAIGLDAMCQQVARSILERDYLESRHGSPDDGLFGLLNLMANLLKFDPGFKYSLAGQEFMISVFCCLFELPSPEDREKPKCKSNAARAAAYDLLVEMCRNAPKNYLLLHGKLMQQHRAGPHSPYPWDYWPQEEGRSECGYVGLTNLGATCYMASCIQHLFMTPQTRDAILSISTDAPQKHKATLCELQRMFAYLMESERKAYCPRSFCRVYQMDHQPLNTGEQKDMAEFFIDLVSKLEEMTPDLKNLVKRIFCGVISNNVVSLDCGHVSRTLEEFYTVRCQVADMRNLHESLDEVTVKDTLEGDNMYTCSQCGKKVRAEKRACFKKLPQILCFNTMRYTFNMVTMLKEKVNTHFSFPMRLDMSGYVEKTLMPHHYQEEKRKSQMRRSHSRNVSESSATGEGNPAGTSSGSNDDNSSSSASSNTSGSSSSTTGIMSTSSECNAASSNVNKTNGPATTTTTLDKQEPEDVEMSAAGSDEKRSEADRTNETTTNGNLSDSSNGDLQRQQQTMDEEESEDFNENYEYDLVGVTVHTGNADGGHYYSFIKERNEDGDPNHQERWFLFNDAEVKLFDPSQIAAECFGGEMTSKTYDSVAEKYLDFSFEKTNSAYMLFYEWRSNKGKNVQRDQVDQQQQATASSPSTDTPPAGASNSNVDSEKKSFPGSTKPSMKSQPIKSSMLSSSATMPAKEASSKQSESMLSPPTEANLPTGPDIVKIANKKTGITLSSSNTSPVAKASFSSTSPQQASDAAECGSSFKATSNNNQNAAIPVQEKQLESSKNGDSTAAAQEQLAANVEPPLQERHPSPASAVAATQDATASNERDQETEQQQFIQQLSEVAKESNNLSKCDIDTKLASTARIPSTISSHQQEVDVTSTRVVSPAPTIASLASTASLSPASTASTASVTSASTAAIAPPPPTINVPTAPLSAPVHPLIVPLAGSSSVASSVSSVVSSCMVGALSGPGGPPSVIGFQGSTSSAPSPSAMLHHGVGAEPAPSSYSSISSLSALTATVGGNIALPMAAVVGPTPGGPGSSFSAVTSHAAVLQSSSSPGCSSGSGSGSGSSSSSSGSGLVMVNRINQSIKRLRHRPLSKELEEWIWQDNRHFLQDRNIFEHTYFNFMWQICGHIPQSLLALPDITSIAAQLSVSFFIETFIHAKEKPTMVLWVELLTKQFNASQEACEWFLSHMSAEPWWPVQVLIQCPNQMVRQMFQRLVIHVIQRLRQSHCSLYLKAETDMDGNEIIGNVSCVTRFIKSLIMLMEHGAKAHSRHLSEFFGLLYEFSRMGEEEALFLLRINVIRSVADFYLGHKGQECMDANSDNEENSSDEALTVDKSRPASLDKMIALVASLVERSRGPDLRLHLSARDYNAIAGGKGFPFLYQQIKDNINPQQTRHLIHALCRCDERLASQIIAMLFTAVTKHTELCGPFFKLITLLTESSGGPPGLPCFSQLVLQRVWDAAEYCPQSALDWLAVQAPRNKIVHNWILQSADSWVERFLLAHGNARVRNAAAYLLVSLVPSQSFRNNYRATSHHKLSIHVFQHREISCEAQLILHTILNMLLLLLRSARNYTDINLHGTSKFTAYFNLLTYCLVSKTEKLMVGPHLRSLWDLFHPRLSEPAVPAHHNKQALLAFWYQATLDCPENASLVANCPDITRNIAFNYILADHDDTEIVTYNRAMLPVYYGLLRMCCQQSRLLTRQLAAHQNLQWAFKNITPHPTQYPLAVDELFRLMTLFAQRHPDASEAEQRDVTIFRRTTLTAYLNGLDARVSWGTLIAALRILVDNDDDRLYVVLNGGITLCFDALHTLHSMYHEATACHVFGDLQELLTELILLINTLRASSREQKKRPQPALMKGLPDAVRRLATLLNTFNPPEMRNLALEVLKELVKCAPPDIITTVLVPLLTSCHAPHVHHLIHPANSMAGTVAATTSNAATSAASTSSSIGPLGSYFPRRGMKAAWPPVSKNTPRPPKAMIQMNIPQAQICEKGMDKDFDLALELFYRPYHEFLDIMFRVAVTSNHFSEPLVHLSLLTGIEAVVLHFNIFAKFWVGIYNNKTTHRYAEMLIKNPLLIDYIDNVLRDERLSLNDPIIANFIEIYYPKIKSRLVVPRLLESICQLLPDKNNLEDICGDLQAIRIIGQRTGIPSSVKSALQNSLHAVLTKFKDEIYSDEIPTKKRKVTVPHITIHPVVRSPSAATAAQGMEGMQPTAAVQVASSSVPDGSMPKSTRLKESVPPSIEITVQSAPGAGSVIKLPPTNTETPSSDTEPRSESVASTSAATTAPASGVQGAVESKLPSSSAQQQQQHSTGNEKNIESGSEKIGGDDQTSCEIIGPTVMATGTTGSDQNQLQQQQQQQKQQEQYLRNLVKDIESHIELIFECLDDDDEGDNTNEANIQKPSHDETDERKLETRRNPATKGASPATILPNKHELGTTSTKRQTDVPEQRDEVLVVSSSHSAGCQPSSAVEQMATGTMETEEQTAVRHNTDGERDGNDSNSSKLQQKAIVHEAKELVTSPGCGAAAEESTFGRKGTDLDHSARKPEGRLDGDDGEKTPLNAVSIED